MAIDAQFPAPYILLFEPKRFKVLYGGRGAGRSWACARALLLLGTKKPIRVLCTRELQKSIDDSVHKLLADQIIALGLSDFYKVLQKKIIGANGTSFGFEGIRHNIKEIKSYEGADYCWVEEAVMVSKSSWGVLIPTIRKAGSEIWLSFNPELEKDYTYQYFVKQQTDDMAVMRTTYRDNPWFEGTAMQSAMLKDKRDDPDHYLHVWEGNCLQMLEGVVFAKELRKAQEQGRICDVPWDRETPVDAYWDLGRKDLTSIWFGQRVAMQYRLLGYFEDSQEDIHYYLKHLQGLDYTWGWMHLPHDAVAKRLGEKRSIEQIVRGMGHKVNVVPRTTKKVNAINAARIVFPNCYFDETNCEDGLDRLRHYRYRVVDGQFSDEPLHDENSNGADAFMTFAQGLKAPARDSGGIVQRLERAARAFRTPTSESGGGSTGWLG